MLKGVNKLIVEVNNTNSEYFERAIFFVRPSKINTKTNDIDRDTDLILSEAELKQSGKAKRETIIQKILLCLLSGTTATVVTMLLKG
ncbi:MAG: hypothetical protein FWH05_01765 [Oscillospiraceae bacterium]|nr:hypothetical protein [Oscillospiraceae bacterium]